MVKWLRFKYCKLSITLQLNVFFFLYVLGKVPQTFEFAKYFDDNMVLQRAPYQAIVWGFGPATNTNITIHMVLKDEKGKIKFESSTGTQKSGNFMLIICH